MGYLAKTEIKVRYKPNNKSFGAYMKSDQVHKLAVAAAEDIMLIAAFLAPKNTTSYARAFRVNRRTGLIKLRGVNPRRYATVYNSDKAAAPVEFGGRRKRQKAEHVLLRAGAHVGQVRTDDVT
jgi:hypothetical protein